MLSKTYDGGYDWFILVMGGVVGVMADLLWEL